MLSNTNSSICYSTDQAIGLMIRFSGQGNSIHNIISLLKKENIDLFTNGPGDQGSILGRVIPKIQKMVPDAALFNTQYYKVPMV